MSHVRSDTWKPVVGYEGLYEVSNTGEVRSLERISEGDYLLKGKTLAQAKNAGGHHLVTLYKNRERSQRQVHHLVLEAFIGPRPEGYFGLHWDDDPSNNKLENLRWGTKSDNSYDSVRNKVHPQSQTFYCPRGHKHAPWNNRTREASMSRRCCLACSRAYGRLYRVGGESPYQHPDFQRIADSIYESLLPSKESLTL